MKTLNRYVIHEEIGQGGMSTVYRAHDPQTDKEVAIKLMSAALSSNEQARARFLQEAQMVMAMGHPAIVPVWDYGEVDGRLYIVMPYLPGGSLRDRLANGPLPFADCVIIIQRIAWALDAAHAQNIIHRDVKPHNILLDEHGQAYLSDFGVARLLDEDSNGQTITMVGTPEFVAPEQGTAGQLTLQIDVYQLGVTLFYMLTGQQPFNGSSFQLISQHMVSPVPSAELLNPLLPPGCDLILEQAMAKEPTARYASTGALAEALAALETASTATRLFVLSDELLNSPEPPLPEMTATAVPDPPQPEPETRKRPLPWRIAALVTILVLALGVFVYTQFNQPQSNLFAQAQPLITQADDNPVEIVLDVIEDAAEQVVDGNDEADNADSEDTAVTNINNTPNNSNNGGNNNRRNGNNGNNPPPPPPNNGQRGQGNGRPPRGNNPPPPPNN